MNVENSNCIDFEPFKPLKDEIYDIYLRIKTVDSPTSAKNCLRELRFAAFGFNFFLKVYNYAKNEKNSSPFVQFLEPIASESLWYINPAIPKSTYDFSYRTTPQNVKFRLLLLDSNAFR